MRTLRVNHIRRAIQRKTFTVASICLVLLVAGFIVPLPVVSAASTTVQVTPASQTISAGDPFNVTIGCAPGQPMKAFELKVSFNPSLLQVSSVAEGNLFAGYTTFFNPGDIDNVAGTIINVYNLIVGPGTVTGSGSLITIHFTARSTSGTSTIGLYDVRLTNETGYIPITVTPGSATVTGGSSPPPPPPPPPPPEPPVSPPSSENTPPNAPVKPSGPALAEVGVTYTYSSTAVDPDGDQIRLRFDWGDGSLSSWTEYVASNTSVSASHIWSSVSNFTIRVIAQDLNGLNSSWSESFTVTISQVEEEKEPPVGSFRVFLNTTKENRFVFDASGIYDPDGVILSYLWDFGDGTTGQGKKLDHTYQTPGQYTVILTVTDNSNVSYTTSQVVNIAASSDASSENGFFLLQPQELMTLLMILVVTVLVILLLYRFRTRERTLKKRIDRSKQKIARIDQSTADIDEIVDGLFAEMNHRHILPRAEILLDAYNDLIVGRLEKNPAIAVPSLNINQVEDLIDRRIQAYIEKKIDEMQ